MKLEVVFRQCIHRFMDGTLQTSYKSWGKTESGGTEKVQGKIYSALLVYFYTKNLVFFFFHYGFRSILLFWCVKWKIKLLVIKFLSLPFSISTDINSIYRCDIFIFQNWISVSRNSKRKTRYEQSSYLKLFEGLERQFPSTHTYTHTYGTFHTDVIKNNYGALLRENGALCHREIITLLCD